MDTGKGRMRMLTDERGRIVPTEELRRPAFRVGDEVDVNGSRFRITRVSPKKLTLRILPRRRGRR